MIRRLLALTFVAAAAICVLPAHAATTRAAAAPVTTPVTLGNESWYSFADCPIAGICLPSTTSTYPADTLHVGVTAGMEIARTYLGLPTAWLPTGATVTGGDLTLPLDTLTANDGSLDPQLSDVEACTTQTPIALVSASTDTPPPVNCNENAIATVVGTPATSLDVNLAPLASELSVPGTNLVLIANDISDTSATWQDVFSSNQRTGSTIAPPSLNVTYTPADAVAATPTEVATTAPAPTATTAPVLTKSKPVRTAAADPYLPQAATTPAAQANLPATTIAGALVPLSAPTSAPAEMPEVAAPATTTAGVAPVTLGGPGAPVHLAASSTQQRIYDYPEVFFVPLLLAAGFLAFGRQLTRPLTRPTQPRPTSQP